MMRLHHKILHHSRHWLVPHAHNDHRPHLIRRHGLVAVAALVLVVQVSANLLLGSGAVLGYATSINANDLLTRTNAERTAVGLPALTLDTRLNQSASLKAANMFAENYWAHVSPSGLQPWHWFTQANYPYTYAGENLAKDFDTSAGTVQGWMNSAGHKANILNANYTQIGFAVQNGTLVGGQTTLVVAHYGATAANPAPTVTPKPTATPKVAVRTATPAPARSSATPTPVPTPTPTATPSPTPIIAQVSPTPTVKPPSELQTADAAPVSANKSLFAPLALIKSLNWGTLVTLGILLLLFLVYLATHITVWYKGLHRWHQNHYKLFAAGQLAGLAIVILVLAVSGIGTVG